MTVDRLPPEPEMICTHSWKTCPVHGPGDPERLPSFKTVLVCLYGDQKTKDGHPFGVEDAQRVVDHVVGRLS